MLEQKSKGSTEGLTWIIPVRKRVMSVRDRDCSELYGVTYVKTSVPKSHAGRIMVWYIHSVHVSQKTDVHMTFLIVITG